MRTYGVVSGFAVILLAVPSSLTAAGPAGLRTAAAGPAAAPRVLGIRAVSTAPKITAFSPISGQGGTVVTILGSNLTGATTVQFNGSTAASFTVVSATEITATVGPDATTGPIMVTAPGGVAISTSSFTVAGAALVTLAPSSGPPGSSTAVTGTGFGSNEAVDVYFDSTDERLAATNAAGSFSVSIPISSATTPGVHWVTAIGRRSTLAAQTPFTVQTNWPQFHNTAAHRGVDATENVLNVGNVAGLDVNWAYTTGGVVNTSPVVANGMVYAGSSDGYLYALNASTGSVVWSHNVGTPVSTPVVSNGVVYFGSGGGTLYAFDAATGKVKWSVSGYTYFSAITVANGVIYAAGGPAATGLTAFNASTGALKWSYPTGGIYAAPAVAGGIVYAGDDKGTVYALNSSTGTLDWSYQIASPLRITTSPAVINGTVYVAGDNGSVYALSAAVGTSGTLKWSFSTGWPVSSSPAVANGTLYIGSIGKVFALNAANGTVNWSYATPIGNIIASSPAVANGVVYVGSEDDNVYAINASTGTRLWSYTTAGHVDSSPAIADGTVYVGSYDDNVYSFGLASTSNGSIRPNPAALKPNRHLALHTPR